MGQIALFGGVFSNAWGMIDLDTADLVNEVNLPHIQALDLLG